MLNRRLFVTCALCSAAGFSAVEAAAQTAGVVRTVLQRMDAPEPGYEIILAQGDIPAGAAVAWHTHPGVETGVVLLGSGELSSRGQPTRRIVPGDSFQIAVGLPHALQNGDAPLRIASTYVVEKGKPLASPAPQ